MSLKRSLSLISKIMSWVYKLGGIKHGRFRGMVLSIANNTFHRKAMKYYRELKYKKVMKIQLESKHKLRWIEGYIWRAYISPVAFILKGLMTFRLCEAMDSPPRKTPTDLNFTHDFSGGYGYTTPASPSMGLLEVHGFQAKTFSLRFSKKSFLGKKTYLNNFLENMFLIFSTAFSNIFSENQSVNQQGLLLLNIKLSNKQLCLMKGKHVYI